MADIKKIATRESYGATLVELGHEDENLFVLDADLADSTKTGMFRKEFPERHINCGIQEANMIDVAAGIASCGNKVFCSSFAMFATGRAYEQIRNTVAYSNLNVKIAASHAGISVGEDGASHQCIEDINLMRGIPRMVVLNPGDDTEARAAIRAAYEYDGPVYIRLGRLAVPVINDPATYKFEIGKGITLREGSDVTLLATGLEVAETVEAAKLLEAEGIDAQVIDIHTIKPIDRELIVAAAKKTGRIVTIEEHSIIGGLGSAVAEVLCEECPTPMMRIGVREVFGEAGPALELLHKYQLDAEGIFTQVKEFVK